VREREDANRTREAGNRDEVEGVLANTLNLFRNGAVGFIDWLDELLRSPPTGKPNRPWWHRLFGAHRKGNGGVYFSPLAGLPAPSP
jgi:hypothetical protein